MATHDTSRHAVPCGQRDDRIKTAGLGVKTFVDMKVEKTIVMGGQREDPVQFCHMIRMSIKESAQDPPRLGDLCRNHWANVRISQQVKIT